MPLALPGTIHIEADRDSVYDDLAYALLAQAVEALRERGVFHIALSGGSTPEPFYTRLVLDPRFRRMPWDLTHIWVVDERRVPPDDDRSNVEMIRESLTDHVDIDPEYVHAVPTQLGDPAAAYEAMLRQTLGDTSGPPSLDFILLGMGDDMHTASLFPGSPALDENDRWIANNDGPKVTPPPRVTMTYPLLNAGRYVAALVTGGKKADALKKVAAITDAGGSDPQQAPITGIQPYRGELHWYLDAEAAPDD